MPMEAQEKIRLYTLLARAVAIDKMMMRVIRSGRMVGFYHEGGIALAPGVAAGAYLRKSDTMWPHYRAHATAHMLAKGVDLWSYIAEHMGREAGCCQGRSSIHASFPQDHVFGLSGNIGANFPAAIGYGLAARYKGTDQVVMNCSGDGSYQEGRAYEALHMCKTYQLPVIFWCENNGILQFTAAKDVFPLTELAPMAASLGLPTLSVDGQDLFACAEAAQQAVAHARAGKGPIFVEAKTLRAQEHSVAGLNNEGQKVRDPKLMQEWKDTRDPLRLAAARLLDAKLVTQDELDAIWTQAEQEALDLEQRAEQSPKATPSIETMMAGVYAA